MQRLLVVLAIYLGAISLIQAQKLDTFSGMVVNEEDEILIGAVVNWEGTTTAATTDLDGWFAIERPDTINNYNLEIHYVGYEKAMVEILPEEDRLELIIKSNAALDEIVVEATQRGTFNSTLDPFNVENITACELGRAACCSLAESFENNGTVNVSFSDAVTGAREIEMLGLRGTYMQMMIENRPTFNRLGRAYGLEYIPGTWIEAIQISKGASTVRNGAQSITGQINTELLKPYKEAPFFINVFGNIKGRIEVNTHLNFKLSDKWSTGLLLHGNYMQTNTDRTWDAFLDIPKKKQINGLSRWIYKGDELHFEINVQGIMDNRLGGQNATLYQQLHTNDSVIVNPSQFYEIRSNTRRVEAFGKLGYFGFNNPRQSLAVIYSGAIHEQKSNFGNRTFNGLQRSFYVNPIFQTNIVTADHGLTLGGTYDMNDFRENFQDIENNRTEHQAGLYAEYQFTRTFNEDLGNAFGLILGVRADVLHLPAYTRVYPAPRLNLKYNFNQNMIIRASAGRGVRSPNLFIENMRYMPSNRQFLVEETIYPEVAWNYGLNYTWNFSLGKREGSLSLDAYRTDFENQLIADIDVSTDEVHFYNLRGKSFANSLLVSYTQDLAKGLEMRLAYKLNDVRSTYDGQLNWEPFSPRHRGLATLHYTTPNDDWQFNLTGQLVGSQRLPGLTGDLSDLPDYRQNAISPIFGLLNAQITHKTKTGLEIYFGGENLTDYQQKQPILGFEDPFGTDQSVRSFDASSVYGPLVGMMLYAGIRYRFQPTGEKKRKDMMAKNEKRVEVKIKSSMECGMCPANITKELEKLSDILDMQFDVEKNVITVSYTGAETNPQLIREAISRSGYDADDLEADQAAHDALPACCQKGAHSNSK